MNYFIYTYIISLLTGRYELNKLTSLPKCGFIAQLVEHRTGIAEVTGSNPVEALIFFRLLLSSCLDWKIHCDDLSLSDCSVSIMICLIFCSLYHIFSIEFEELPCYWSKSIKFFFFTTDFQQGLLNIFLRNITKMSKTLPHLGSRC